MAQQALLDIALYTLVGTARKDALRLVIERRGKRARVVMVQEYRDPQALTGWLGEAELTKRVDLIYHLLWALKVGAGFELIGQEFVRIMGYEPPKLDQ